MALLSPVSHPHTHTHSHSHSHPITATPGQRSGGGLLKPLRKWIDQIAVRDRRFAHLICRVIPCCCPFERDISLFGHTFHIPPLCKLNPVYDELVSLRFRALSHLADDCGEDINRYIC
ncbi:Mo-dependent nitrogenase C-terminal domain-containing protein [Vacuolonema iberomarrocanum]|uniref:Mo-dependent nitrogenase C-terminal domain-containing protein n=1 Tax=Vacuolonema iberomarrocanum TaxID=3454632 RepID=UPI001A0E8BA4|nr:Mo-dependent nitrogenase C-terminal domain-containing protein [filamentous cyanobacterium LEGE 07170]